MLKNLGKRKCPFLISVPVSELLKAIPYDAGTYCRIPDVKVDQIMKKFWSRCSTRENLLKTAQTIPVGKNEISGFC